MRFEWITIKREIPEYSFRIHLILRFQCVRAKINLGNNINWYPLQYRT